jgi:FkbM family methyltransferase
MRTHGAVAIVSASGSHEAPPPRPGGFSEVHVVGSTAVSFDSLKATIDAVELAQGSGAEWMIALGGGVSLAEDAFELAAPALQLFDAVFGAAQVRGSEEPVARLTRLAFDEPERLPHALLNWWMPQAHLVRVEVAAEALRGVADRASANWKLDYTFELWDKARCMKSAQPLLLLETAPEPLDAASREDVLRRLDERPVYLPIVHGDAVYHLPYTGRNAGIEREQSRGLFFEAAELEELRKAVKPGARVVDVGANTGNHTIFFAGPMKAARVIPFEPLPAAAAALKAAVERNALDNVDLSWLGTGVSDREGRAKLVFSGRGGLGATSLVPDLGGEIPVAPLDAMIREPVDFLKVDVEGMEMQVLAGAADLIRRSRPLIFIEIANRNTGDLLAWLEDINYGIARIFTDKGHANYLLEPQG